VPTAATSNSRGPGCNFFVPESFADAVQRRPGYKPPRVAGPNPAARLAFGDLFIVNSNGGMYSWRHSVGPPNNPARAISAPARRGREGKHIAPGDTTKKKK